MKSTTFENRTKAVSANSKGFQLAKSLLTNENKIKTCWTSGSGRFTTNLNYHDDVIQVLQIAGMKNGIHFTEGNDSPRGGQTGLFIAITSKGKAKRITN